MNVLNIIIRNNNSDNNGKNNDDGNSNVFKIRRGRIIDNQTNK